VTDPAERARGAGLAPPLGFEPAPAKINLALHVTGRRADGYHALDSLVVFAAIGDTIEAVPSPHASTPSLAISGPLATGLDAGADNLVLRAVHAYASQGGTISGFDLRLDKQLPVASGIGGGSADAAATLRLLARIAPISATDPCAAIAPALGADVPMCLLSAPLRATGIGDRLQPVGGLPRLPMVLVNPRVAVSTPTVFKALAQRDNPGLPALPAAFADTADLAAWLATPRNDLEAPAMAVLPGIADALTKMRVTENCLLARMSGSGATVFGLFPDDDAATRAAVRIQAARPDWWTVATHAQGS
jgi:4-diphosphocytidyl-2-C-methyl-D-erythritol kinase